MSCTMLRMSEPQTTPVNHPLDGRRFWWIVLGIVLLAMGVRLSYLCQVQHMPFFSHPVGDAASYWEWAGRVAAGDWMGSESFYQAPAYPYFLAVVRLVVGDDLWHVRIVQAAMGAVSCGLLAVAGGGFFSRAAGVVTGGLVALYGPAIFFDGLIQKATLGLLLMSVLLCLLAWMGRGVTVRARAVGALALGVVLGILALTREQALLFGVVVLAWFVVEGVWARVAPLRLAVPPLLFLLGMVLVLGAVGWRNYVFGGEVALTTVQAGPNFYIGNHDGATGRYVPLRRGHESPPFERADATALAESATGRPLTSGEVSAYWSGQAWEFILSHPGRWLRLLGYKWMLVWNSYEIPDTESYTLYAELSWLLSMCGRLNHFGVLCPLAAVGAVATLRRWRRLWVLYVLIGMVAFGVAVFYVFGRYRYPLVPLLAMFAGAGLVELYGLIRPRGRCEDAPGRERSSRRWVNAVVLVVVAVPVNLPLNPERRLEGMAYANLGVVLGQRQEYESAIYFLEAALECVPEAAEAYVNLGTVHRLRGDPERALYYYGRALEIAPGLLGVDSQMAEIYESQGRLAEAIQHYTRALAVDPADACARRGLERLR